jgi:hypothetical protein
MWIPCVVFAHVFAGYFMARMLVVMFPKAWADFKRKICCGSSSSSAQQKHTPKPGEGWFVVGVRLDGLQESWACKKGSRRAVCMQGPRPRFQVARLHSI